MTTEEAIKEVKLMTKDWLLRMESMSFLMIVDKVTGKYYNIYANQFPKGFLKIIADNMEKHKAIKEYK